MRVLTARKSKRTYAAHGSSGRSAHWTGAPCPVERRGGYRCADDGFLHDSKVRNELYVIVAEGDAGRTPIAAREASQIADSLVALGDLERAVAEHAGAYHSGPAKTDELPSVRMYAGRTGRYVFRIRGCLRYRRLVRDLVLAIPGIALARP